MNSGYISSALFEDDLPSHFDWIEKFEYGPSRNLISVIKTYSTGTSIYLYGDQQQIGIVNHTFRIEIVTLGILTAFNINKWDENNKLKA